MTQIDTSGYVREHLAAPANVINRYWSDLSPFTQGFIEAALRDPALDATYWNGRDFAAEGRAALACFSDLAPETLARFMDDCGHMVAVPRNNAAGHQYWAERQRGLFSHDGFPPLHLYLAVGGKVRIREAA